MPEPVAIAARARHAFRNLANGMYLDSRVDVTPHFETLVQALDDLPDLVGLELYAKWEQLKPHYKIIGDSEQAKTIETRLRSCAQRYLSLAH